MRLNDIIKIGDKIKIYRKQKHISQKKMAEILKIPYSTYSNYENNNRTPTADILKKIAAALDVSVYELIETKVALNDYLADIKYNPDEDGIVDPRIFSQGLARTHKTLEHVSEETGIDIKLLDSIAYRQLEILPKDKIKLLALALNVEFSTLLVDENKASVIIETMDLILEDEKFSALDNPITNLKSALYEYLKYKNIDNSIIDSKINEILSIIEGITNIL